MKKFQIMNGRSASLPDGVKRRRERKRERRTAAGETGVSPSRATLGNSSPICKPAPDPTHCNCKQLQSKSTYLFSILSVLQYFISNSVFYLPNCNWNSHLKFSKLLKWSEWAIEAIPNWKRDLRENFIWIIAALALHSHIHICIRFRIGLLHSRLHCNSS